MNVDGTYDSICLICFAPFARRISEADQARLELGQVSDPGTLDHYKRVGFEKETASFWRAGR
jgi:hypothetical protein